ncbi:ABC transporter ATP-binding protein [Aquirhabdus parva]|uniref:ABC transporter ATP-binding protein n=1 Tax=Aquirhabdus parva TaxID=2283318 RepID=A0A345P7A2_9GAMM|nr:ABC transporter ATP-binding protein [Aquirhabdus parva]AXI03161.1 ABC transporter ATP-binding protein [Aquirhabdus parva]
MSESITNSSNASDQSLSTLPLPDFLPDYHVQSPEVKARFKKLYQRKIILEIRDLVKHFETPQGKVLALNKINFDIYRREFVCVIGPSGCGKSTLSRILAGLESYDGGTVLLDGKAVEGPSRDRGMVFQGYTLFPWRTVKHNVMFGLEMSGKGKHESEQSALQWLDLIGLSNFADAYPHQLSGGMKQRVAIARALVNEPRILLMDEPFGALDAQTRCKMQKHLLEIWRNIDITILFVTHDLDEAILLADRILVLKAHPGEVQEIIEVPVPRPRSERQINSPEFLATRARLDQLIHGNNAHDDTDDEPLSPFVRLTSVDDNVE